MRREKSAVIPQARNFFAGDCDNRIERGIISFRGKNNFLCMEDSSESLVYMLCRTNSALSVTDDRLSVFTHPPDSTLKEMWKNTLGRSASGCRRSLAAGLCMLLSILFFL